MGEVLEFKRKTNRKAPERKSEHLADAQNYCMGPKENNAGLRINAQTGVIDAQAQERNRAAVSRIRQRMEVIENLINEIKTLGHKLGGNNGS